MPRSVRRPLAVVADARQDDRSAEKSWVETGPLDADLAALVRNARWVDVPADLDARATTREACLDSVNAYLATIGLDDVPVSFFLPPRFRSGGKASGSTAVTAGIGAGFLAGASRQADFCPPPTTTRRRLIAKVVGVGAIAAALSALGPVGRKVLAAGGWCDGVCGDCRNAYCYRCDLYVEFYYCPNRTYPGYCENYCTFYKQRCDYRCNCICA